MMTATRCPSIDHLRAYVQGQLSEQESNDLFVHLRQCPSCQSEIETVGDEEDSLIANLRAHDADAEVEQEPDCRVAIAKALGALAAGDGAATSSDLVHLPKSLGEYEIVRPLGRGGMGNVYLARHTKLGREVAVKVLATHRLSDKRASDRFEAEMRAIGRLSHPNIVTAHDAREVDGVAVLVTEYIDGMDLGELVSRIGPLPVAEACEIIREVAVALQYTSDQGYVHRDVKPSNIMLHRSGEVKLLDLGLARLQLDGEPNVEITGTGQTMGTADYIAPEQVTDSRRVDVRADIYALGCTLFKLVTGNAPFSRADHRTAFAKMTAHVSTPPPSLSQADPRLPDVLVELVDSMLAKQPGDRPQTPADVAQSLTPLCQDADLPGLITRARRMTSSPAASKIATTTAAADSTQPWIKRPVPRFVAIAAGLLGLIVGLCGGWLIKIKYPDGTEIELPGPSGTEITMQAVDDSNGPPSAANAAGQPAVADPVIATETSEPPLLQFGVLPDSREAEAMIRRRNDVPPSQRQQPLPSGSGTYFPVADGVDVPMALIHKGVRYQLVKDSAEATIPWKEIRGHIETAQSRGNRDGTTIDLRFDPALAERMRVLTSRNIDRQLAVIVNGRIVSAPRITSEISSAATITGKLSHEEQRYLMQIIDGGLVVPMRIDSSGSIVELATPGQDKLRASVREAFRSKRAEVQAMADASKTKMQLKMIGIAFHNFHDVYYKLPGSANHKEGAAGVSHDSKILPFSWRVAILPFIEQNELFEQYRFDQEWDSEANLKLLDKMPGIYRSPFAPADQPSGHTNYQGVVTGESAMGKDDGVPFREIRDGTSNTLLIVETKSFVPWTKPQDLEGHPEAFDGQPLSILMADGAVRSMDPIDREELAKMITRSGGERLKP